MPFVLSNEHGVIHARVTGTFGPAEMAALLTQARALELSFDVCPHRVLDFSETTRFDLTHESVRGVVERRRDHALPNVVKSALVVSSLTQYGYARMYQSLNDNPEIRLAIFSSIEDAAAWMALPGTDLPAIPFSATSLPADGSRTPTRPSRAVPGSL